MNDVAAAAGVARATLDRSFPNREALLAPPAAMRARGPGDRFEPVADRDRVPARALEAMSFSGAPTSVPLREIPTTTNRPGGGFSSESRQGRRPARPRPSARDDTGAAANVAAQRRAVLGGVPGEGRDQRQPRIVSLPCAGC